MINVGCLYWIKTPYYDKENKTNSFKYRPALVIGNSDETEYVILPVSRCKNVKYINKEYDIKIVLKEECYIRTHKQTFANVNDFGNEIKNIKRDYSEIYELAITMMKQFNNKLFQ